MKVDSQSIIRHVIRLKGEVEKLQNSIPLIELILNELDTSEERLKTCTQLNEMKPLFLQKQVLDWMQGVKQLSDTERIVEKVLELKISNSRKLNGIVSLNYFIGKINDTLKTSLQKIPYPKELRKQKKKESSLLSQDEIDEWLDAIRKLNIQVYLILSLALETKLTLARILELKKSDLPSLHISKKTRDLLSQHVSLLNEEYLCFSTKNNKQVRRTHIYRCMKKASQSLNLPVTANMFTIRHIRKSSRSSLPGKTIIFK